MGYTIVQISQNLPPVIGGGETYANRLVAALKRRGINLIRIGEYRNTLDLPDDPHDKTISIPGFNETVFSSQKLLSTSQALSELLLDIKPDVIHTHNFFSGVLGLLSAPSNVPLIHTGHHTPYWSTLHERHTLADLHTKLFPSFFSAPRLSAIMASSKYFLEYLKPFLHKSCLAEVVYPIIPHAFADVVTKKEAADRLGLNAPEYLRPAIILCPSRLTPRKRIESLFYALSKIHSINWICIISAGEEAPSISYRTFLEELAHRLKGTSKNKHFPVLLRT
jgi:glycosyltransferase involved in cell wall biosynthesis